MPIRDLDTDQKFAATATGDEVVVSAGAGSGKTRLLVGRYLHLLKTMRIPMYSIVAITFTNKAANQMKVRIAQEARKLANENPGERDFWLKEVAAGVHAAPISTIHSFCNSILRRYPVEAGLDPLFTIIDDTTLSELRSEVITAFLKERMNAAPETAELLIRTFGVGGYRRLLRTMLDERSRILKYLDDNDDYTPDALERGYSKYIRGRLDIYSRMLHDYHTLRPGDDSLSDILDSFVSGLERLIAMVREDAIDRTGILRWLEQIIPIGNKGSPRKWESKGMTSSVVRTGVNECASFVKDVLVYYEAERGVTSYAVSALLSEYELLEQRMLQAKKSRSYLDHDDSLIETWRLLRNNISVGRKISRLYRHILVDEFQDTDSLQMDIIRMIAGNVSAPLFTVGDPKQSIYRFRGADVTVFNDFITQQNVEFKSLKLNYRSSPAVVHFINHVFGRIMGRDESRSNFETGYKNMKPYKKNSGSSGIELNVFDASDMNACRTAEAGFIARRAAELKDEYGYSYGGMALIMRKGTKSSYYEEAFLSHGIPFVNLTRGNAFDNPEAYDIANLLGWLCSPDDAALFTGLLLSPFFSVSADFLYSLSLRAGEESSMPSQFLREESSGAIGKTLTGLLSLHERVSIREVLERAFDETGYTLTLLADPLRGENSLAVLDHILSAADRFEAQGGTIADFSRLLLNGELSSEKSVTIETGRETLTIISIHRAKGMEYDVVFLADLTGKPGGNSKNFLIDYSLGPGTDIRNNCKKTVKTFVKKALNEEESRKNLAESKRLFYVGCTRARNFLVLSGGNPPKKQDDMFEKDNWMGWLYTALSITPEGDFSPETPAVMFSYNRNEVSEERAVESAAGRWKHVLSDSGADGETDDGIPDEFLAPIPDIAAAGRPETLSPTQVSDYLRCPSLYMYRHIYGIDSAKSGDYGEGWGTRYGNFAHMVLQGWDFNDFEKSLLRVDELSFPGIKNDRRQKLKESLRLFSETELYSRIRSADDVHREEPFAFIHDDVLVRGTVDVLFRTGNFCGIVDYKTDRLEGEDIESAAERYRSQLCLYALAVYRAEYVIPSRLTLYFLTPGVTYDISCDEKVLNEVSAGLSEIVSSIASGDFSGKRTEACNSCACKDLCGAVKDIKPDVGEFRLK